MGAEIEAEIEAEFELVEARCLRMTLASPGGVIDIVEADPAALDAHLIFLDLLEEHVPETLRRRELRYEARFDWRRGRSRAAVPVLRSICARAAELS